VVGGEWPPVGAPPRLGGGRPIRRRCGLLFAGDRGGSSGTTPWRTPTTGAPARRSRWAAAGVGACGPGAVRAVVPAAAAGRRARHVSTGRNGICGPVAAADASDRLPRRTSELSAGRSGTRSPRWTTTASTAYDGDHRSRLPRSPDAHARTRRPLAPGTSAAAPRGSRPRPASPGRARARTRGGPGLRGPRLVRPGADGPTPGDRRRRPHASVGPVRAPVGDGASPRSRHGSRPRAAGAVRRSLTPPGHGSAAPGPTATTAVRPPGYG
jgi:hypothetical protein